MRWKASKVRQKFYGLIGERLHQSLTDMAGKTLLVPPAARNPLFDC
jgi:hypothetical protein